MLLTKTLQLVGFLAINLSSTLTYANPVMLACETQFVGCVKELDGRKICAPPRLQKNMIELNIDSIRHLDDYGYFSHQKCDVSEAVISCAEYPDLSTPPRSFRSTRRLTIERTTGRLDSSVDAEFVARDGEALKRKGWINTYAGYCTVRDQKNLF